MTSQGQPFVLKEPITIKGGWFVTPTEFGREHELQVELICDVGGRDVSVRQKCSRELVNATGLEFLLMGAVDAIRNLKDREVKP